MRVVSSAPGKIIIGGEHFVVYGSKAIAGAILLRALVEARENKDGIISISSANMKIHATWKGEQLVSESSSGAASRLRPLHELALAALSRYGASGLTLKVKSEIPRGAGLGSSAAVSVASAAAASRVLGREPSTTEIIELASVAEKLLHYRASGIDLAVATLGGLVVYGQGETQERLTPSESPCFILIDSGTLRRTGEMVRRVSKLREKYPSVFKELQDAISEIVDEMVEGLKMGRLDKVGELMTMNHGILGSIGVSTPMLDAAVGDALRAGALGAKLTGGGGGGYAIALVRKEDAEHVSKELRRRYRVITTALSWEGVRPEEIEEHV